MLNAIKISVFIFVVFLIVIANNCYAQTVTITSPATGSTYTIGSSISVTGTAGAPFLNFVSSVVVTVSTASVTATGTTSYSASVPTTGLSPGTYTLTVTNNYSLLATGLFSGSKTATISVTLLPPAPIITYATPQVYTVGTAITTLTPTTSTGGAIGTFGFGTSTALTGATLNNPRGIGIDASGNVYVTNSGNNTISKYSSSGTYIGTFGTGATLSFPKDIVFDSSGNAYVLNLGATPGTGSVYKYNSSGVYQSTILSGLNYALGLTIDASDNIYVADQGAVTVKKYSTSGALLLSLPTANLSTPLGVAVDASGNIYVANNGSGPGTGSITKYNSAGTFISTFLTGYTSLQTITIDGAGNIYVGDNAATNTVYVYNQSGTLLTSKAVTDPEGIEVDTKGTLFVSSYFANQMNKFTPTGGFFLNKALPAGLSFNSSTGSISGTPTAAMAATVYTVTAYNAGGSGNTTVTITVNPTAPTGSGGSACSSGAITLTASGSLPAGGVYTWYAALTVGGPSLGTGATFVTPTITATTTYYVDYTLNGATSTPRTAVTATVNAAPAIAIAPTGPTANLYLSYSFTGNANDVSGNNNNGTLQSAPSLVADRYGAAGSAYSFNGSSQYVSTATSVASPGPQTFSISVWFKTTVANNGVMAGFGNSQTGSSTLFDRYIWMNGGKLIFYAGTNTIQSTGTYNDGNWHLAAATFSSATGMNLYVDGILIAGNASYNTVQSYTGWWMIGYSNATYYFNGSLDDIAIYNTVLTAAQLNVLYGAGGSSFCAGNSFSLTANTVTGATYAWSGPGGFSSTLQNPTVTNAVAGTYALTVTASTGCTSTINVAAPSNAITYTWSGGAGTTNPTTAGNWDQLPTFTSSSNLVIPAGLSFYPSLTANETIYGLTIANGASLNLNGYTLSVGCNIYNNANTGGTGILDGSSSTTSGITFNGQVASQKYTGTNTASTDVMGNITINNTTGGTVTITGGPVEISNLLTLTKGNLVIDNTNNGALTLKGNASSSLTYAQIDQITSGYTISGNVNYQVYFTGGAGYRNYRSMASPVYNNTSTYSSTNGTYTLASLKNTGGFIITGAGGATNGFDASSNNGSTLKLYNTATSNYTFITSLNSAPTVASGTAFYMYFRGSRTPAGTVTAADPFGSKTNKTDGGGFYATADPVMYTYTGVPNQGSLAAPTFAATDSKFYYLANPYAATLDANAIINSALVSGTTYFVNTKTWIWSPSAANYAIYNFTTPGLSVNGGKRYIVPGQGFFVQAATTGTAKTLTITEAMKSVANSSNAARFLYQAEPLAVADPPIFRLKFVKDSILSDEIAVAFIDSSKATTDNHDAIHLEGSSLTLSSLTADNQYLAIDVRPFTGSNTVMPLYITPDIDTTYSLKLSYKNAGMSNYKILLADSLLNQTTDISNNSYSFSVTPGVVNTYGKRFKLIIQALPAPPLFTKFAGHLNELKKVLLNWNGGTDRTNITYQVQRSTNRAAFANMGQPLTGDLNIDYQTIDNGPAIGMNYYRLVQTDAFNNTVYSDTIAIANNPGLLSGIAKNGFILYPNAVSDIVSVVGDKTYQGTVKLRIYDNLGKMQASQSFTEMNAQIPIQADISNLKMGVYTARIDNNSEEMVVIKFIKK